MKGLIEHDDNYKHFAVVLQSREINLIDLPGLSKICKVGQNGFRQQSLIRSEFVIRKGRLLVQERTSEHVGNLLSGYASFALSNHL